MGIRHYSETETGVVVVETAVAAYDDSFAAFQAAADALQGEGKPILKFHKSGRWMFGQDDEVFADGTEIAGNLVGAEWGWVFWRNGKPEDRRMVRIASGQRPALRADLGHTDEDMWERDDEGKPVDPWAKTFEIPARELDGDQREMIIAGGSRGFEGAFKKLLGQFGAQMRMNAGKVPVVELNSGNYKHATYGLTYTPVMAIKEWVDVDGDDEDEGSEAPAIEDQSGAEANGAEETSAAEESPKAKAKSRKAARF